MQLANRNTSSLPMHRDSPIVLATRGSALALAQAEIVLNECRAAFPDFRFDVKVIRTTGDKLETASLSQGGKGLPKGLFTKELEVALLNGQADFAVHSLKDLPTGLPAGLKLGAVSRRANVRDVLICSASERRSSGEIPSLQNLRKSAIVGTSSTRRRTQLLAQRPDLNIIELRGNIITRLQKLSRKQDMDAIVLAAAGLERMNFRIASDGRLIGHAVPEGLSATLLDLEVMIPCVGQGALGIEVREGDERVAMICQGLNHLNTEQCVTAERSFLAAMGGGCASPVAAYAEIVDGEIHMRAISFPDGIIRRAFGTCTRNNSANLGRHLAEALKGSPALQRSDGASDGPSSYAHRESPARV
jgi:hydroxymethylbilane synthase